VTFKKNDTIVLTQDTMVLAYAMKDGKYSDTVKYVYTKPAVNPDPATVDAPEFKLIKGAEGSADTLVVVYVAAKHDSILVAMNKDFATATDTTFVTFKKNDTIVMTQDTMVVLAYAMKDGESSKTVKYEYKKTTTPVDPQPEKVAAPVINKLNDTTVVVLKGEADSIFVAMGVDSAAALTNGFAKFTGNDTIKLAADTVILAYAMKGEVSSDTVKYEFKKAVSSANETKELAGVSVYPNPSNGEFNVSVAENVTVEVFNTNGQIVKRARLNAGVNAMQLNNSGIYFVRFTAANGQVAIKKVVVR
ncbi:T9SS type A sorting domain-containing protein, partial [bacterium]|nr:T9SS type A sorting domain-containing protein [bacterium]